MQIRPSPEIRCKHAWNRLKNSISNANYHTRSHGTSKAQRKKMRDGEKFAQKKESAAN